MLWFLVAGDLARMSRLSTLRASVELRRGLCAYRLSSTKMISPTRARGSTRLSVFLRTSLAQRSGYAGGQVFHKAGFQG